MTFHHFPKISLIDEFNIDTNIIDFYPYQISRRSFLCTIHSNRDMKLYRLRKHLEYKYLTKIQLEQVPLSALVYRDIFLVTYKSHCEYIKIDYKGNADKESVTRFSLW